MRANLDLYTDVERSSPDYYRTHFNQMQGGVGGDQSNKRFLNSSAYGMCIELDVRSKRVIEGKESGFSDELTAALDYCEDLSDNFDCFDFRQTGEQWVENTIKKYLNILFSYRKKYEPKLNKQMLYALDMEIDQLLDRNVLKQVLFEMLDLEKAALEAQKNLILRKPEMLYQQDNYGMNSENLYDNIRKRVTNENAWRKYLLKLADFQFKYSFISKKSGTKIIEWHKGINWRNLKQMVSH